MKNRRSISAGLAILVLVIQVLAFPIMQIDAIQFSNDTSGDVYVHTPIGMLGRHTNTHAVPWGITNIEIRRYPGPAPGSLTNIDATGQFLSKAFCLEPNVQVNVPFIENFPPHGYSWSDRWGTNELRNMLGRIAWYGWETSRQSQVDQAITQAAIWQYMNPGLSGGFTDKSGNPLTNQISDVIRKAEIHKDIPKFTGTGWDEATRTLTMKPGDSITLTPTSDSPDVSNSELLLGSVSGLSLEVKGNSIVVTGSTDVDTTNSPYDLRMSRINSNEANLSTHFLVHRNSQDILVSNGIDPAEYPIRIEFEASAELEINKTDEDTGKILDGAEFRLMDSAGKTIAVTQTAPGKYTAINGTNYNVKTHNGQALIKGLPAGNFQVIEVVTPENYAKPANPNHPVVLENNSVSRLSITNKELPVDLLILKIDEETGERIPLPGVKFSLFTSFTGGNPVSISGKTIFETDANGSVSLKDFKSGTYYIEESDPPHGYILPSSRTKVDLNPGSSVELKISNTNQVGKILIEKLGPALTGYTYEELVIEKPKREELFNVSIEVPESFIEEPEITHELPVVTTPDEPKPTETVVTDILSDTEIPETSSDTSIEGTMNSIDISENTTESESIDITETTTELEIETTKNITDAVASKKTLESRLTQATSIVVDPSNAPLESSSRITVLEAEEHPEESDPTRFQENTIAEIPSVEQILSYRYPPFRVNLSAVPYSQSEVTESSENKIEPKHIDLLYQIVNLETNSIVMKDLVPMDGRLHLSLQNGKYVAESTNKPGETVRVEFEVSELSEAEQHELQKLIPIFTDGQNLEDAVFEIYAAEDIYSQSAKLIDGNWDRILHYKKDQLVDTITTGSDGKGLSKELPLGVYHVKEIKAPLGYSLNPLVTTVELKQIGQISRLIQHNRTFTNARQTLRVSFEKTFEESEWFNDHMEAPEETLFGLFTVDDYTENGVTIPANSLVETSGLKQNDNGQWIADFEPLFAGTYRLEELHTGESYNLMDPVDFRLEYTSNAETVSKVLDEIHNDLIKSDVQLVKVDSTDERPIANVVFELIKLNEDGTEEVLATYETDENGKIRVEDLTYGDYIFQEVSPPEGYVTPKKDRHDITIDSSGQLIEVMVENEPTQVRFTKKRLIDEKELPGAKLSLRDSNGNLIEEWISGEEPYVIKRLKVNETYTLTEDLAPLGYATAQSISFTILDTGEVQSVTMFNDLTWIDILKVDSKTGEAVAGAELELTAADGLVISTWTSSVEPHTIRGLAVGETYTVKELQAPNGYASSSDVVTFIVEDRREVQVVTFENDEILVEISKTDLTTGEELPGALLSITDSKGIPVEEWTSSNRPHVITNLHVGETYILTEDLAPLGYSKAQSITFTIQDTGEVQKVHMQDDITRVTLTKTDFVDDAPVPDATIIIRDTEDEIIYEGITDESGQIKLEKIPAGTYTFEEKIHPEGYILNTETFSFEVHEDGSVTGDTAFTNEPTSLRILKNDNRGRSLPGAAFELRRRNTDEIMRARMDGSVYIANANGPESRFVTDKNGLIEIRYLPQGEYDLVEVRAPKGYEPDRTVYRVNIHEASGITTPAEFVVVNRPILPNVPNAGDPLGKYVLIVAFVITGIVSLLYGLLSRRHRRNR